MEGFYKKSKRTATLDGVQFQVGLTVVFLLNALRTLKRWKISTENEDAGKFDDVVIELSDGSAVLLQAKHKDSKRISKDQLLSVNPKNADFSLPKYFLSYQEVKSRFNIRNVIICTNADVDKKKLKDILVVQQANTDSVLHFEGEECSFIKFKENIISDLRVNSKKYQDNNLQYKGTNKAVISDGDLKEFLEKLQFFTNYPSGSRLCKVIDDQLLPSLTGSELRRGTSYKEIYGKVEDWFRQGGCEYLTETEANTMFCEIKSDQFCKTLKEYDVWFTSTGFSSEEGKRIYHVSVERGYLLQALRMFHALQEHTTLFVNPRDGVEVYKQAIESFRLAKYTWLVLIFHKNISLDFVCEICSKLKGISDTNNNKKVMLIGSKQNVQRSVLKDGIFEVDGSVRISNLAQRCWEKLVRKVLINYQGKMTNTRDLLESPQHEEYDKALDSEGLEKLVRGEEIKVGTSPVGLDPNILSYYINRTIERAEEKNNEITGLTRKVRYTEENIFEVKEKFVIISDCAGMGKTTVLSKLAETISKKFPNLWVIRIELNECSKVLRDHQRGRRRTITMAELLNSSGATKLKEHLERFVFSMNEKVVVLLDSFDEISPHYTELVLSLLRECQEGANFAKVLVTTRPHMNGELEALLKVKPFVMQPFTTQDQVVFLANYWRQNLALDDSIRHKCERYAKALISKMSAWVEGTHSFTAIPLQVMMLAEIFQEKCNENDSIEWEGCKEYLLGTGEEPELPEKIEITKLYDMFIENKLYIFLDKANPTGTSGGYDTFKASRHKYFMNHQSLALQEILYNGSVPTCHLFSHLKYDSSVESIMIKIGIVQMAKGKLEFLHKTFAEYFVAKTILEISALDRRAFSQRVDFQQLFIDYILCNPPFTVIRAFIESTLEDVLEYLPANVFERYRSLVTSEPQSLKLRLKLPHLLAQEGHLSILKMILKSIESFKSSISEADNTLTHLQDLFSKHGIDIDDENGSTPLHRGVLGGHFNMIKFLVEYGSSITKKNKMGESVLHLAAWNGHLQALKYLTEHDAEVMVVNNFGFTPLHWAAQEGHLEACKFLRGKGIDVNLRNVNGFSALHSACIRGHSDIVKWLIDDEHADIQVMAADGSTVFHLAAQEGHAEICKILLERGFDPNIRNHAGNSGLHSASGKGHSEVVKVILEQGQIDVNAVNENGFTSLHYAAQEGRLAVCKFLLEKGISVDLQDKDGCSALLTAATFGHLEIVKWLVERLHADVEVVCHDGSTALHLAAQRGHLEICKYLLEKGVDLDRRNRNGTNVLHSASGKGHLHVVRWLVEREHVDVNVVCYDGTTALHSAAREGHLEVCKYLLERGFDLNLRNIYGFGALHAAARHGHLNVVKWLVECAHIDVSDTGNDRSTALHYAAHEGHVPVCKYLLERGVDPIQLSNNGLALHLAIWNDRPDVVKCLVEWERTNVNAPDINGFTAIDYAIQRGQLDMCKMLVEKGVDPNLRKGKSFSFLNTACIKGQLEVIRWLVECHQADVNAKDDHGFAVLHYAARGGHLDLSKFLVEAGADIDLRSGSGFTALHLAILEGHLEVTKFLVAAGADVSIKSDDGLDAMETAAQNNQQSIVEFLTEAGSDKF